MEKYHLLENRVSTKFLRNVCACVEDDDEMYAYKMRMNLKENDKKSVLYFKKILFYFSNK